MKLAGPMETNMDWLGLVSSAVTSNTLSVLRDFVLEEREITLTMVEITEPTEFGESQRSPGLK